MRAPLIVLLLVPSLLAAAAPAAAQGVDPGGARWVDADFTLALQAVDEMHLSGLLAIRRHDIDGRVYGARDLRDAYAGAGMNGAPAGEAFAAAVEAELSRTLAESLSATFPRAQDHRVTLVRIDRASLAERSQGPTSPPVLVRLAAEVRWDLHDLGLGAHGWDALRAALGAGARAAVEFPFATEAGYRATYRLVAPPGLAFSAPTDGSLSRDGRTLVVARDNTGASSRLMAPLGVELRDPNARAPREERIDTRLDVRIGAMGATGFPVAASALLDIRAIDAQRFAHAIPENLRIDLLGADGVRALVAAGAMDEDAMDLVAARVVDGVRENLTRALGAEVEASGGFDAVDLAAPADGRAGGLDFAVEAAGAYPLDSASWRALDAALHVGAAVTLDLHLVGGKDGATVVTVRPPVGLRLVDASRGDLQPDGSAVFRLAAGEVLDGAVAMRRSDAVAHMPDAAVSVKVDVRDIEISIPQLVAGERGALVMDVEVRGRIGVLEVPAGLRTALDPRVRMDRLTADDVRFLRDRAVLDAATMARLEAGLLDGLTTSLQGALGGGIRVTGGFVRASLDHARPGDPIEFAATAQVRQSSSTGNGENRAAAIALYTATERFVLPRIGDVETSYLVVLPRGLEVQQVTTRGGSGAPAPGPDGRSAFTVRPSDDEAYATVSLAVTPTFIAIKFWPTLVAGAALVLVLGMAPLALRRRRRRAS